MNSHQQGSRLTEGEVLAAAEELIAAFSRTDTQAYFEAFAPEATFIFHPEAQRLESRSEYEDLWNSWLAEGWSVQDCESTDARVQICGTSAVFSHTVKTTTRVGEETEALRERETIVFTRDCGRIVAVHEHLSPAPLGEAEFFAAPAAASRLSPSIPVAGAAAAGRAA